MCKGKNSVLWRSGSVTSLCGKNKIKGKWKGEEERETEEGDWGGG